MYFHFYISDSKTIVISAQKQILAGITEYLAEISEVTKIYVTAGVKTHNFTYL